VARTAPRLTNFKAIAKRRDEALGASRRQTFGFVFYKAL
jgi:hypothetical protein